MKVLYSVFVCILLISQTSALTQLNIYLDDSGNAEFLGESNENITLPEGVTLENGQIRGTTSALTSKQGTQWSFNYELANSEIVGFLPEGAVLDNNLGGEVFIERGVIAIYTSNKIQISYHVGKTSGSGYWIMWTSIFVLAIIGYYFYHIKKRDKKKENNSGMKLENILHERQNLILARVKETGRVKMSYLRKQCNMPKASFSRHIRELEKKKLIVLSGEGKNKFVELR